MTNKEAADILRKIIKTHRPSRSNGKSTSELKVISALDPNPIDEYIDQKGCRCLICGKIVTDKRIFRSFTDHKTGVCFECVRDGKLGGDEQTNGKEED